MDDVEKLLKVVFTKNFFRILILRSYHFGKKYLLKNVLKMLVFYSVMVVGATLARINYVYIEKEQDNKKQARKGTEQDK